MRLALPVLALLPSCVVVSKGGAERGLGVEVQAYPSGVIAGLHGRVSTSPTEHYTARVAANVTDREGDGERDDEEGEGWGLGVGYRRYLGPPDERGRAHGWLWGARVDLWDLEIDWVDDTGGAGEARGKTDVLVLQPTVELGYGFPLSSRWSAELVLAGGFEINVDEDGRDVGEGPIGLVGITLVRGGARPAARSRGH